MERTEAQRTIFFDRQVVFLLVERENEESGDMENTHCVCNHVGPANACRCMWELRKKRSQALL